MYTLHDLRPRPTCEAYKNLSEELAKAKNTIARQRAQLFVMSDSLLEVDREVR